MLRKLPKWLFIFISAISFLLIFISSEEPLLPILSNTILEPIFINILSGNSIIFNLSIGILVSSLFYLIVVYFPEKQKQKDILPQVDQYVTAVISRSWRITSEIIKNADKNYDLDSLTELQIKEACEIVNPKENNRLFFNDTLQVQERNFGYFVYVEWEGIVDNINKTMHFLPYIDTGLVRLLNNIRNSSLKHSVDILKNVDSVKNTNMSAWSDCIYDLYKLGQETELYYKKHINKKFSHPYRKPNRSL